MWFKNVSKGNNCKEIKYTTSFKIVNSNLFDITYNRIKLFIFIFLTKAKYKIKSKQEFYKDINRFIGQTLRSNLKGSDICLCKSIISTNKQHHDIKTSFPSTIHFNNKLIEIISMFLLSHYLFLNVVVLQMSIHVLIHFTLLSDDCTVMFVNFLEFARN